MPHYYIFYYFISIRLKYNNKYFIKCTLYLLMKVLNEN